MLHSYQSKTLQRLIESSDVAGWRLSEIDWNQPPLLPQGVEKADYIDMISQLYHAEIFTLKICSRLLAEVPDFQAARFICAQMTEEARHAEGYSRYIHLWGEIAPINEKLEAIFLKALEWKGNYGALIVALNVVLEGEALQQQQKRIDTLPCPIFKELNQKIIRDESRHSAFGLVYLQDKLPVLSIEERGEIVRWIKSLWGAWKAANENRYEKEGAAVLRTSGAELDTRLQSQLRIFEKIGLAVA